MTLNSSGPISLAGTTAGVSIEIELGGGGTTQISLNDTNVRTLAGVASGAITMPTNFYGQSSASAFYYINFDTTQGIYAYLNNCFNVDSSGNSYFIGAYNYTATGYICKINTSGTIQWAISTNLYINNSPCASVIDSSGNLYVMTYNTSNNNSGTLWKISSSGSVVWQYRVNFGGSSVTIANFYAIKLIINSSGYIDIFGNISFGGINTAVWYTVDSNCTQQGSAYYFQSSPTYTVFIYPADITYDGTYYYMLSQQGANYLDLIKFNRSNLSVWHTGTSSNGNSTYSVVVDSSGNVYTYGYANSYALTIYKFNSSGSFVSAVSGGSNFSPVNMVIDSSNNIYIYYLGTSYSTNGTVTYTLQVTKFNSSLTAQWTRGLTNIPYTVWNNSNILGGYFSGPSLIFMDSTSSYFYIMAKAYNQYGSFNNIASGYACFKLPTDGSLVGDVFTINNIPFLYNTGYSISFGSYSPTIASKSSYWSAYVPYSIVASTYTTASSSIGTVSYVTPSFTTGYGSATYPLPGTYSWLCPSGVTSVSVVAIGGGGGGGASYSSNYYGGSGGGGGGLGYKNNYSVTAGNSYTVVVGAGGQTATNGGDSYFVSTSTAYGQGGKAGVNSSGSAVLGGLGGTHAGDGGGNGGAGGGVSSTVYSPGGGGGAGGYAGNAGTGGTALSTDYYTYLRAGTSAATSSGAGAGGTSGSSFSSSLYGGNGGSGVNVIGQGPDGVAGTGGTSVSTAASPGSYGTYGGYTSTNQGAQNGMGGTNAGGGGGGGMFHRVCVCCSCVPVTGQGGIGGSGIVRIIWPGSARTFPSTNTGAP